MPSLQIGHAAEEDIGRVLEIRHAAFSRHAPSAYSPEQVRTLLADVQDSELHEMIQQRQLFVARLGGRVDGVAGWTGDRLRHVYVDPDRTRRGIASQLVAMAEADFGHRTGLDRILAGVALHAEPFYRRIGYQLIERRRAWDDSEFLEMAKQL